MRCGATQDLPKIGCSDKVKYVFVFVSRVLFTVSLKFVFVVIWQQIVQPPAEYPSHYNNKYKQRSRSENAYFLKIKNRRLKLPRNSITYLT